MSSYALLEELNRVSALAAILATGLLVYGFVRLSLKGEGLIRHLSIGLLLMHFVVFLRTGYWHIVSFGFPAWKWPSLIESTFSVAIHMFFNLLVVVAGYFSLKALWLAIPTRVRADYTLFGAAFYPRGRSIAGRMRTLVRRRK